MEDNNKSLKNEDIIDIYPINSQYSKKELQNYYSKCELINEYIDINNKALELQLNNKFPKALSLFEKASTIADQLNDDFKKYESEYNKGIIYFHLKKIKEAINLIQSSFDYFYTLCNKRIQNNNIQNLTLLCKSGANLCMCKILLSNDKDNCTNLINDILNIICQEDLNKQKFCITYLIIILFNVNSLLSLNNNILSDYLKEDFIDINQLKSSGEANEEINKINQLFSESFYNFIATQEVDPWINALNIINQRMKEMQDNSGIINSLFHHELAIILKYEDNNAENNSELNEAKLKLSSLIKSLRQINYNNEIINDINELENDTEINEEEINNIIEEYRYKLGIIREIYEFISSIENNIEQNKNQDDNNINNDYFNKNKKYNSEENLGLYLNSKYYLNLLLNNTKSYFEDNVEDPNFKKKLIQNIETALDSINNLQNSGLDFSNINLFSLDPELSNYINNKLAEKKYEESEKKSEESARKTDLTKLLRSQKKNKNYKNSSMLNDFFEHAYKHIYDGEKIKKINYRTNGIKEHYFQIEYKTDKLQYFVGKDSNQLKKEFDFYDILKIKIGIVTDNVINKLNAIKLSNSYKDRPYRFISFIIENDQNRKSLDLLFDEGTIARKWFYGLHYYCFISKRPYKICSCTKYLLFRMKCKMIHKLHLNINKIKTNSFAHYMKQYYDRAKEKKSFKLDDDI